MFCDSNHKIHVKFCDLNLKHSTTLFTKTVWNRPAGRLWCHPCNSPWCIAGCDHLHGKNIAHKRHLTTYGFCIRMTSPQSVKAYFHGREGNQSHSYGCFHQGKCSNTRSFLMRWAFGRPNSHTHIRDWQPACLIKVCCKRYFLYRFSPKMPTWQNTIFSKGAKYFYLKKVISAKL